MILLLKRALSFKMVYWKVKGYVLYNILRHVATSFKHLDALAKWEPVRWGNSTITIHVAADVNFSSTQRVLYSIMTDGGSTSAVTYSLAFFLLSLFLSIPVGSLIIFVPSPRLRHVFSLVAGVLLFRLAYGQEGEALLFQNLLILQQCLTDGSFEHLWCVFVATVVFSASSLTAYVALSALPRQHCGIIMFIGAFSGLLVWWVKWLWSCLLPTRYIVKSNDLLFEHP